MIGISFSIIALSIVACCILFKAITASLRIGIGITSIAFQILLSKPVIIGALLIVVLHFVGVV